VREMLQATMLKQMDCMAKAEPFGCWSTTKKRPEYPFKGFYFDGEMDRGELLEKLPPDVAPNIELYCLSEHLDDDEPPVNKLMDEEYRKDFMDKVLDEGFNFICFDNLVSLFIGRDENLSKEYFPINEWFLKFRGYGVHVSFIHHTGKDPSKGGRGTSFLIANANTAYQYFDLRKPEDAIRYTWSRIKYRGYLPKDDRVKYLTNKIILADETESGSQVFEWQLVSSDVSNPLSVMRLLAENVNMGKGKLSLETGISINRIKNVINTLVRKGYIQILTETANGVQKREILPDGQVYLDANPDLSER
jgi:hypothetical protein